MKKNKSERILYDPIHGHYSLPLELWQFIDNPVYQRLRELKQLGTTSYVFPGGNHSRFEHCLGVGYLSRKYICGIKKKQPELDITSADVRNITLAGLVHDLGHGPFSHIFDTDIVPALGIPNWTHEQASVDLLNYMVDTYNLDLSTEDFNKVSDIILGIGNGFMHHIVNNKLNSIDVDKFDYIERDCHCLGFREFPFDTERLMKRSMVIQNTLCFDEKVVHSIYSLFSSRFNLFQQCYSHRVGQGIGLMIRDALIEANQHIDLVNRINQPELYYQLNDSILAEINHDTRPQLNKAKEIIRKIHCREIYKQVGQIIFNDGTHYAHVNSQRVVGYNDTGIELKPDDIIVKEFKLTYGNPAEQVLFYNDDLTTRKISREKVSTLIPDNYCDMFLRVFVKDKEKFDAAKSSFEKFAKKELNIEIS